MTPIPLIVGRRKIKTTKEDEEEEEDDDDDDEKKKCWVGSGDGDMAPSAPKRRNITRRMRRRKR